VKAEDLRTLDGEELTSRLKGARRELYELRFKLAVGQLDDHRQIRKVRKDIARILTVVHARRLGEEIMEAPAEEPAVEAVTGEPEAAAAAEPEAVAGAESAADARNEETPENVEAAEEAPAPAPASRRTSRRKPAAEDGND
jgi:large subunit ribosomal protein L29